MSESSSLRRHIPEIAIDWALDAPDRRWQTLEGTLCFADISGFTALAERLAQRGRIGGEELVETLGRVFTTMLGIARERGGTLLKFGGDALVLFFQGDDHPIQAASAAVDMRSSLRKAADIPTSVGPLKLSMSVGLHSGNVHFFLVGTSHRELLLLGPAANRVVEAEKAANAGDIVISAETAAALPKQAVKARADGERLLRWRKAHVKPTGPRPERSIEDDLLQSLFPDELGAFLAPGAPDPEHRVACISFVRFSGTDAMLEGSGPDVLAAALERTIGDIQQVLIDEGVTLLAVDLDRDGAKLFMAAGVPYGHEDDEGVMLRALRRIADMDLPFPLQIGVNRGHVFAAEVGDAHRAGFSAMGDTTNTAARIAANTPFGKIFAHPATLDECLTLYEVTPAEPLVLKGKKAPLVVYEVGAELGLREREGLAVDEFIGRREELARLRAAINTASEGVDGVIVVLGETGLGKTRLLREATAHLDPSSVFSLRAEPYGSTSEYQMFRDPVRKMLHIERDEPASMQRALAKSVESIASELVPLLALIGDVAHISIEPSEEVRAIEPRFRPERIADAMIRLLEAIHPDSLIIAADDAHWCDEASTQLLGRIAQACTERPWLMVAASRKTETGFQPGDGDTLSLNPMLDDDIKSLVELATEAAPLRDHEMESVVDRAGGYPLFAEEIVRAIRDMGSLDAVPESLEAAMSAQVDALDRPARRVLQYASVLGQSYSMATLEELFAGEGQAFDPSLIKRLREFLVTDDEDRMRFRSGLLRDTIYEGVAYRLRARLHQAAGADMERRADDPGSVADALTLHFSRAGDHARTWKYGRIAGGRAAAQYANANAARFYELSLEAARRIPDLDPAQCVKVWRDLGHARVDAGLLESSLDAHRRALKVAGTEPMPRSEALYHLAKAKDQSGSFSPALRDLTQAQRLIEAFSTPESAKLSAEIASFRAIVLYSLERPRAAFEQAARAAEVSERAGDRASLARSLALLEMMRMMLEGPGDGGDLRRALSIYEELGDVVSQASARTNLGVIAAIAGRWDEAADCFGVAGELYLQCGNAVQAALSANNLGELWLSQGRLDEAEEVLVDALRVMRASRWAEGMGMVQIQMGHVLIERSEFAEADDLLARTSDEFIEMGQPHSAAGATIMRAGGKVLADEPEVAIQLLDEAIELVGGDAGMLAPKVALFRALALAKLDRFDAADRECVSGWQVAREFGLPYEEGLLSQAALQIARRSGLQDDRGDFAKSAERLNDLGVRTTPRSYALTDL